MKFYPVILASSFLLLGCTTPQFRTVNGFDSVTETSFKRIEDNVVPKNSENTKSHWVSFNLLVNQKDSESKYFLIVTNAADGDKTIWVNPGKSLTVNIDGHIFELDSSSRSPYYTSPMYWYKESGVYPTDFDTIRELLGGKSVKFRMKGQRGSVIGELSPENIEKLKSLLDH